MSHTFEPMRAPDGRSHASREPDTGDPGGPAPGRPGTSGRVPDVASGDPAVDALAMTTTFPGGRPAPSAAAHRLATEAVDLAAVRDERARQVALQAVQQAAREAFSGPAAVDGSAPTVRADQRAAQQAAQQAAARAAQHATRASHGAVDASAPAQPLGHSLGGPAAGPAVPQGTAYVTGQGLGAGRVGTGPLQAGPPIVSQAEQDGSRETDRARAPQISSPAPSPDVLAASAAVLDLAQSAVDLEPAMALAGRGFAGVDASGLGASSPVGPQPGRPGDALDGESRRSRRDAVQANAAQPPDNRDERAARRGRSGLAGPAAGRALGSKITPDAPRGDRGAERGPRPAGGRRYLPLPDGGPDGLPEGRTDGEQMPTTEPPRPPEMPTTEPQHATGPLATSGPANGVPSGQPAMPPGTGSVPWLQDGPQPSFTGAFAPSFDGYPGAPQPELGDPLGDTGTRLLRAVDDDEPAPDGPAPSLVRPYSRTGGRTKPGRELDLEALVVTTVNGREAWSSPLLNPEHVQVIGLCVDTTSVAEVAAKLSVPIGVARVIIADMVDLGLVEVGKTSANGDERDPAFLRRVLSGLQRL